MHMIINAMMRKCGVYVAILHDCINKKLEMIDFQLFSFESCVSIYVINIFCIFMYFVSL